MEVLIREQLSALLAAYFSHRNTVASLPRSVSPRCIGVLQQYLEEHDRSFDLTPRSYHFILSSRRPSHQPKQPLLQLALRSLCESFWQNYRSAYGIDTEPPDHLVDIIDFVERKYFLQFSYNTGQFRPD